MAYQKFRKAITSHPFISSFLAGALASLSLPPLYITPAFLLMGFVIYHSERLALARCVDAYIAWCLWLVPIILILDWPFPTHW